MKFTKSTWAAVGAALFLAACGGGDGNGTQSSKVTFSSMVSFGDSLSDVGTYDVGAVAALGGGVAAKGSGKYTVNSPTAKNWTELISTQLGVIAPCPAQTGLNGTAPGFTVPVLDHAGCTNYAQGGARVTQPYGPYNVNLGGDGAKVGQLTVPVVDQIAKHLTTTTNGKFSGTEIITVMAGGNDGIMNTLTYMAAVTGTGPAPLDVPWSQANASTLVTGAMTTAATDLVTLVKNQILANGAKYVVVVNLPNLAITPFAAVEDATVPNIGTRNVIGTMVNAFNTALASGLAGVANVVIVDAYASSTDQFNNPSAYGLTNVTGPACNLTSPSPNAIASSLVCNASNVNTGDVSHYLFADTVHPTPYGYQQLAQLVSKQLVFAGWL